jgi:hypothetical protein
LQLTQEESFLMRMRSFIMFTVSIAFFFGAWVASAQDPALVNARR